MPLEQMLGGVFLIKSWQKLTFCAIIRVRVSVWG